MSEVPPRAGGPAVVGAEHLLAKHSAVDRHGSLRTSLLAGVIVRRTRPVPHEDGHLTEVARTDWPELGNPIVQVHVTTTLPGRVRAWGLHQRNTDRLFVVSGTVKIALFDGREGSPTFGLLNEFIVSERSPALVCIPPDMYHGWKNIGTTEASIINMPDRAYIHDGPDALDLPWDSDAAQRTIPYVW